MIPILDLNHVAIHVANLEETRHFYGVLLGFQEKQRPDFDFPGVWYQLGPIRELHVIAGRNGPVVSAARGAHFAMQVKCIDATAAFLQNQKLEFNGPSLRPDGVQQIFLQDPDGYFLEFTQLI